MITLILLILLPFVISYLVFTDLEKQLKDFEERVSKLEKEKYDNSEKIF